MQLVPARRTRWVPMRHWWCGHAGWKTAAGRPVHAQGAPQPATRRRAPRPSRSQRADELLEVCLALLHRAGLLVTVLHGGAAARDAVEDGECALLELQVADLLE